MWFKPEWYYKSLTRRELGKEMVGLCIETVIIAVVICFVSIGFIGFGFRQSYYAEAPRASLPAPVLPETALTHAHYDTLDAKGQEAYVQIEADLRDMKPGSPLPFFMDDKDVEQAYDAVLMDNPDIFWVSVQYFSYHHSNVFGVPFITYQYLYDDPAEVEAKHAEYMQEAANVAEQIKHDNPDQYSQGQVAYNWVAETLQYAHSERDQTVSGAFDVDDGYTVCAGYSKTYKMICDQLGIPCVYVSGSTDGEEDSRHAWNMAVLEGQVFYIDSTWGDYGNGASMTWFTPDKEIFEMRHKEAFQPKLVENIEAMNASVFVDSINDVAIDENNHTVTIEEATEDLEHMNGGIWALNFQYGIAVSEYEKYQLELQYHDPNAKPIPKDSEESSVCEDDLG